MIGGVKMYHIAICDDDKVIGAELERIILNFSRKYGISIEVDVYFDGTTLVQQMEQGDYYDLIFLDIEMKNQSGIEVGTWMRETKHNDATHIIYISAYPSYALKLFKIRPFDFLIKPFREDDVIVDLEKSLKLSKCEGQVFSWKKGRETHKALLRDIFYFCSRNKEVEIHTKDGVERFYGSLEKVASGLTEWRFFYCHQSFLINYNQVAEFKYDRLIMKNGEVIGISQTKRKQVRAMLQTFEKEDL